MGQTHDVFSINCQTKPPNPSTYEQRLRKLVFRRFRLFANILSPAFAHSAFARSRSRYSSHLSTFADAAALEDTAQFKREVSIWYERVGQNEVRVHLCMLQ